MMHSYVWFYVQLGAKIVAVCVCIYNRFGFVASVTPRAWRILSVENKLSAENSKANELSATLVLLTIW